MNNTLEQKRQNIEKFVKVLVLCVVAFLVSPFIFATIKGLAGLANGFWSRRWNNKTTMSYLQGRGILSLFR